MHMARLWSSSRDNGQSYSLESLSTDLDLIVEELKADQVGPPAQSGRGLRVTQSVGPGGSAGRGVRSAGGPALSAR